jgi:hypothetical protein
MSEQLSPEFFTRTYKKNLRRPRFLSPRILDRKLPAWKKFRMPTLIDRGRGRGAEVALVFIFGGFLRFGVDALDSKSCVRIRVKIIEVLSLLLFRGISLRL